LDSRVASFYILKKILDEGNTIEGALDSLSHKINMSDRGFIRHLVTTTIRRLGQLDKIINHMTKTKLGNTQMAVRHVLRLGITQLLFMEVPAYAAVDSSVGMIETKLSKKLQYLKNPVNAILRNVDRDREQLLKKFGNTRLNFPKWLLKSWDARFGNAIVKEMIAVCLEEAPLDITIKPQLKSEDWANSLQGKVVRENTVRLEKSGKINDLAGYHEGEWWVQDITATLPASLLGAKEDDTLWDLCAAPGGKTAQSAAKGIAVTAVDMSHKRLKRLEENMKRLNLNVDVITSDVLNFKPSVKADYILLDAPCSSTGTVRRHPEILHSRQPQEVKELVNLQSEMLDHVSSIMKKGSILVYSVCSMEQEEGPDQINALLQRDRSLKRKEILKEELVGLEQAILETGDVQTLPHFIEGGMDGFFIARLEKT
jgi:16S rRNA (cytosine967-C5)-methyltransferase